MTAGVPFGVSPEDLAALMRRVPMGAPQAFAGTSGVIAPPPAVAEDEAAVRRLEQSGAPAAAPAASGGGLASGVVPLPPRRPAGLAFDGGPAAPMPQADMPAPNAAPAMGQAPAGAANAPEDPSLGDRISSGFDTFRRRGGFDMLGSIGMGLLSAPTWAGGVAAGLRNHQDAEVRRSATDLAKAEHALKLQKLGQGQRQASANARFAKSRMAELGRAVSDEEAATIAGNAPVFQELLKGSLPPQEVYKQTTDAQGNVWSVNTRSGQATVALQAPDSPEAVRAKAQAQAEGAAAGKPEDTVSLIPEQERAGLGLPAGSYQRDSKGKIAPVNPTGTTINMGAEKAQDAEIGKAYGKQFVDYQTAGRNAGAKLNTLALMEQAMNAPGFYSGVGGESVKRAQQFMGALGLGDAKASTGAEVFDALSNKVVLDGLGGALGPGISNTDRDYIARTAPTLARSQESNKSLIGIARKLAEREQIVATMAREYATRNGGRLDTGFDAELDQFSKANPLFPTAGAGATAAPPQEPPRGAPNGTRMAPDGRFYAPDPNRPGKYLQVH